MDFLYDESSSAYSFIYNGTQYYYVRNLQGDVVRILNTSGATVVAYSYDAWGKCTVTTGASNAIANANPIRYRGYYYDTDTGFYYLQSRYYDPSIMRFISTDSYINANGDLIGFNMYAYCGNNPIVRSDDGGTAFETVFDIVSLMASVAEFMAAPNPVTFLGMAADAIDLIPFVTGVGEVTRAARLTSKGLEVIDTVHDASKALDRTGDAIESGWKVGDDITKLTKSGKAPSWDTVRSRYWKNEAHYNEAFHTNENVARMLQGKPPQFFDEAGNLRSAELHHIDPRRLGGSNAYSNLLPLTPTQHAAIDPFRRLKIT